MVYERSYPARIPSVSSKKLYYLKNVREWSPKPLKAKLGVCFKQSMLEPPSSIASNIVV